MTAMAGQNNKIPLIKRAFDLVIASLLLILLSPLFLLLALVVLIAFGWPVIFSQVRPGYHGNPFSLHKFRSMKDSRDAEGILLPDAQRLTLVGRLLRSLSLDELPELVNVIKGEMSLVGPRPLLIQYLDRYSLEQARRHDVLPGMTGWAQVNGRNSLPWNERFTLDVWYVDHWSFWLDLKILLMTPVKVLKRVGISQIGQATMEEFKGRQG